MQAAPDLGVGFFVLQAISWVLSLGALICFIMVLVQMFKRGQTGLGIACIVLTFCGIGPLVALVYGWIKSSEWGIQKLMLAWTALAVLSVIVGVGGAIFATTAVLNDPNFQQQLKQMQKQ